MRVVVADFGGGDVRTVSAGGAGAAAVGADALSGPAGAVDGDGLTGAVLTDSGVVAAPGGAVGFGAATTGGVGAAGTGVAIDRKTTMATPATTVAATRPPAIHGQTTRRSGGAACIVASDGT